MCEHQWTDVIDVYGTPIPRCSVCGAGYLMHGMLNGTNVAELNFPMLIQRFREKFRRYTEISNSELFTRMMDRILDNLKSWYKAVVGHQSDTASIYEVSVYATSPYDAQQIALSRVANWISSERDQCEVLCTEQLRSYPGHIDVELIAVCDSIEQFMLGEFA